MPIIIEQSRHTFAIIVVVVLVLRARRGPDVAGRGGDAGRPGLAVRVVAVVERVRARLVLRIVLH